MIGFLGEKSNKPAIPFLPHEFRQKQFPRSEVITNTPSSKTPGFRDLPAKNTFLAVAVNQGPSLRGLTILLLRFRSRL